MIKLAINKFCNKKQKNEDCDKNHDNELVEYCLRGLDKKITTVNNLLENEHKSISLLQKCNEENKEEIHELKRKNKMLSHVLRIFVIYFIMRS